MLLGMSDGAAAAEPAAYSMRLSRLTIDKLGVKLYDRASAVVAELIANGYDADAENVNISLPLGTELAGKADGAISDKGYAIVVRDDGHGMTPQEAQDYFLVVGADRRSRADHGKQSRAKQRRVMGRKGIGKLAPFGICRRIEVRSAGGERKDEGFRVSHFILDFDEIVRDEETAVPIRSGDDDKTWSETHGTIVTLSDFLPKRVPNEQIFVRQVARRFALADEGFAIDIDDTRAVKRIHVPPFQVDINPATKVDLAGRPIDHNGECLPVTGWLAFGKHAYRDEEEAGVRIYARGKIVATTRDFEQPAGFTGEFTARSYLVGEIHAEWLDADDTEDLIRTDRQGILWDSDYGEALRAWGAALIKEIAKKSAGPRRESKGTMFLQRANLKERAESRYGSDSSVTDVVLTLGHKIGGFASEDELGDPDYVSELAEVILSVAPHQALIQTFQRISGQQDKTIDDLVLLFSQTRIAEMASYAQIAAERVASIRELRHVVDDTSVEESDLQRLIARAPWLIQPDWSVISENQALKTFRDRFTTYWREAYGEEVQIAISYEKKRPDFTLIHLGRQLHVVELKKPKHAFANEDYRRLENYLEAFEAFFSTHQEIAASFPDGWVIDLIADSVNIRDTTSKRSFEAAEKNGQVRRKSWYDFMHHASIAHEQFLDAHDKLHGDG